MISKSEFRKFANIPFDGTASVGLLVIRKARGYSGTAFSIPKGSLFSTGGVSFVTVEDYQFSESSTMIEVGVQAQVVGVRGNVPAEQTWQVSIANLTATNPAPFSLGEDAVKTTVAPTEHLNIPDDSVIESQLELAKKQILNRLALETLPDEEPVDRAVYLLTQFYVENRSTQGKVLSLELDDIKDQKTIYYRERVFTAINREINNLLAPYRDATKFMPDVPQTT